jgi:LysM repeat protein
LVVRAFEKARRSAQSRIDSGEYQDALFDLSIFYDSPDLNETERQQLVDMLDPLAAKVVYSREHHLAPAHRVGQNETLVDVAAQYNVPWELLKNINGVRDPLVLVPRTELKVVRGPFRADIDLKKGELALFLGRLYAGRFPISTGKDPEPKPGEYQVREKRTDRAYYTPDGGQIPGRHADNPYGRVWIHLGGEVCIHGSPESGNRPNSDLGCISLSPIDADDVYGILSQGSKVTIRR